VTGRPGRVSGDQREVWDVAGNDRTHTDHCETPDRQAWSDGGLRPDCGALADDGI
jgi:hypothetical protein